MLEVAILLKSYLVEYRFPTTKNKKKNLHLFNMKTGINESRTLAKHISCKCKCKFDSKKCRSNQKWNTHKCWCECKNPKEHYVCQKNYTWSPATCSWQNAKNVGGWRFITLTKYWRYIDNLLTIQWLHMMKLWKKQKPVLTTIVPIKMYFNKKYF